MEKKNILVIRLSAMGDVAMTVPIVAEVARNYDVNITIVTRKAFAPLFSRIENATVVSPDLEGNHNGFIGIFRFFKELKKLRKWNAVVDLHDVLRSKLLRTLFKLSGTKVSSIEKDRSARKQLTRKDNKQFKPLTPIQERYADVFKKTGFPVGVVNYHFYKKEDNLSEDLQRITGPKTQKWIGIAPFAKHANKMYPIEEMTKIVEYFSVNDESKVFLFGGGKTEKEILDDWEKYPNTVSLAGKISLENEMLIMAHLDCMLSMDSANMHLANLVDVPVVSVWGATHPYAGFVSKGNALNKEIQLNLDCRPCSIYGNKPCYKGTNECMKINPDVIIEAIEKIIE